MGTVMDDSDIDDVKLCLDDELSSIQNESAAGAENMNVYVRLRPLSKEEGEQGYTECISLINDTTIQSVVPADSAKFKVSFYKSAELFTFTQAFGAQDSQFTVFENSMKDIIQAFVDGSNCLVFTYGNSGSGKTYTMQGTSSEPGIIPLTIELVFAFVKDKVTANPIMKPDKLFEITKLTQTDIEHELAVRNELVQLTDNESSDSCRSEKFSVLSASNIFDVSDISIHEDVANVQRMKDIGLNSIKLQNNSHYSVWVSFMEVYNEKVYDLLQPVTTKRRRPRLNLGEDKHGNIYAKGLREIFVNTSQDVFRLLRIGRRNLKIASTKLNYQSSRSHCILNLKVIRVSCLENTTTAKVNVLSFCDLAGSERCGKTNNTGMRLKEAGNINTSLLVLKRCVETLRQNQTLKEKKIVPFRESKLTHLFSGFFTGKGKATMIINISPSSYTFDEALNTLKFSALAKEVTMVEDPWSKLRRISNTFMLSESQSSIANSDVSFENADDSVIVRECDEEKAQLFKEVLETAQKYETEVLLLRTQISDMELNMRMEICKSYEEKYDVRVKSLKERYEKVLSLCDEQSANRIKNIISDLAEDSSDSDSDSDENGVVFNETYDASKDNSLQNNKADSSPSVNNAAIDEKAMKNEILELEAKLQTTMKEKNLEIKELEKKLSESNELIKAKEETIKEKVASAEQSSHKLEETEKKIKLVRQEISNIRESEMKQKKKLEENDLIIKKSSSELSNKNMELEKLREKMKKLKDSFESLQERAIASNSALEDRKVQLSAKDEEIARAMQDVEEFQEKFRTSESALEELQQNYLSMSTDYNKAIESLKELEVERQHKESLAISDIMKVEMSTHIDDEFICNKKDASVTAKESEDAIKCNVVNVLNGMSAKDFENLLKSAGSLKGKLAGLLGLDDISKNLSAAKEHSASLESQVKEMSKVISSKDSSIDKLTEDFSKLDANLKDEISQLKQTLNSKQQLFEAQEKVHKDALDNLSQMIEDQKKVIDVKVLALESQKKEHTVIDLKLKEEMGQLKQKIITQKDLLETEKKAHKESIEQLNSKKSELEKSLEANASSVKSQEKEHKLLISNHKESISKLTASLASKDKAMEDLRKESTNAANDLNKQISDLKSSIISKDSYIKTSKDELQKAKEDLNEQLKKLKEELASKTAAIASQKEDADKASLCLNDKISELRKSLDSKDVLIKSQEKGMNKTNDVLTKQVAELQETISLKESVFNAQLKDSNETVSALKKDIENLKKEISAKEESECQEKGLKESLKEYTLKNKELEQIISSKDEVINAQIEDSKRMSDDQNEKIAQLMKDLNSKEIRIQGLEKDDLNNRKEKEELQQKLDEIGKTAIDPSSVLEEKGLQKTIDSLNKKIAKVEQAVASKESALSNFKEESQNKIEGFVKEIAELKEALKSQESSKQELIDELELENKDLKKSLDSKISLINSLEASRPVFKPTSELSSEEEMPVKKTNVEPAELPKAEEISNKTTSQVKNSKARPASTKTSRGRLAKVMAEAAATSSIPTPIKKSQVETPVKLLPAKKLKMDVVDSPANPRLAKLKIQVPGTPVRKKLRPRGADVDYVSAEAPAPAKRKKPSPVEAEDNQKVETQSTRQRATRSLRSTGTNAPAVTPAAENDEEAQKPAEANEKVKKTVERMSKAKASALSYLSPKKETASRSVASTRPKRMLYDFATQPVLTVSPGETSKLPAAGKKVRQAAKRKQ